MADQIVSCGCGRKLRVRAENLGQSVRCPGCRTVFRAEAPQDELVDVIAVAEEKPRAVTPARPAPVAVRRDEPDEPEERRQERPRRKKGRRRSSRGFLARLSGKLQGEFTTRTLFVTVAVGIGLLICAFIEGRLSGVADATPQRLTLAQLAANGFGKNAHVIVSGVMPCDNYVYRRKSGTWTAVYVPVVPAEVGQGAFGPRINPQSIRVIVMSTHVGGPNELSRMFSTGEIHGTVVNSVSSLTKQERELLEESYPGADFRHCYLLQVGREPTSPAMTILLGLLGTVLMVGAGLLLAVRYIFRNSA